MPATPAERKALLFLAAIGVLGGGVRAVTGRDADASTGATRLALARQMAAVDSASERKTGKGRGRERTSRRGARAARVPNADGARADGARAVGRGRATREAPAAIGVVDVDVADASALERLPGIGPALARRIVEERAARGAFGSIEGLQRVRGVGPKLSDRVRPHVTFSGIPRPPDAGTRRPP